MGLKELMNTWGVVGVQRHDLRVADLKSYGLEPQIAAVLNFTLSSVNELNLLPSFLRKLESFFVKKEPDMLLQKNMVLLTTNIYCYEELSGKKWD